MTGTHISLVYIVQYKCDTVSTGYNIVPLVNKENVSWAAIHLLLPFIWQ